VTDTMLERSDAPRPDTASAPNRSLASTWTERLPALTLENLLWIVLIVTAIISRFWNLGYRTLHHDESLHTYYSWLFARDGTYIHDPLMHGPFLFHANALIYTIFGVSDATSRLMPAFFGVLLVGLPWLLRGRRFLGPWGALAAGYMLLISPAFLYYTRYIRHDPYTAAGALLLAIAVFRYLERPQRRWILTAFVTVAFLLANHEIVFAIALAMVMVLLISLVFTHLRPLILVHIAAAILAGVVYLMFGDDPLPEIPWENPTAQMTRDFYGALFDHPLVLGLLIVGVMFVIACAATLRWQSQQSGREGSMNDRLLGDAHPNTVAYGVYHALRDPAGLLVGATLAFAVFIVLFTTFFTNPRGFATATYAPDGTLLYWLGQHDVQRGEQPWFYFITEGFQYEWLGIFFAVAGLIVIAVRALRGLFGGDPGPNPLFNVFNAVWFVFMFAVLSWAGEKMPWLIIHFALPAFLVAAALLNEVIEGAIAWFRSHPGRHPITARYGMLGVFVLLVILAMSWFFLAAKRTYGLWSEVEPNFFIRTIPQAVLNDWWHLAIPPLLAMFAVAIAIWMMGPRKTAYTVIAAAFVVLSLFQVHQGFRLAYLDGDVAIDTLIYNTTSPDVTDVTADLHQMSQNLYGDDSLRIQFDGCVQWPFNWYLRDFPNRQLSGVTPPDTANGPEVIIGHPWNVSCGLPHEIPGYTSQIYVLRWHEPEQQVYREFAIAPEIPVGRSAWLSVDQPHGLTDIARSIWSSISQFGTAEGQQELFRLMMFREMPQGLTSYQFTLYIRNDMLPAYNDVRYGE
jgi:predicted membrane-bound mannosyltransferase